MELHNAFHDGIKIKHCKKLKYQHYDSSKYLFIKKLYGKNCMKINRYLELYELTTGDKM